MSAATRLRHRLLEWLRQDGLFEAGHHVAVAVSGGIDSVVLLELLVRTQAVHGATLSVCHVDHGVRPDAVGDARFVRELAARLELPCVVAQPPAVQPDEASMRAARYAFFDQLDCDRVALAHHRDDQAETLLLQLLRGAASGGAAGMRVRRDRYIRPLLRASRRELRAWADVRALRWRDDPSNHHPAYARNHIRQVVIPALERIRPGAAATLARSATRLAEDADALETLAADVKGGSDLEVLRSLPVAVRRRVVQQRFELRHGGQIDAVLRLVDEGSGEVELGPDTHVVVERGVVRLHTVSEG